MRKILLGVLILGMVSCTNDTIKTKTELYSQIGEMSSSVFSNNIKLYLISHSPKELNDEILDSIREASDKQVSENIRVVVLDVYK